MSAWATVALTLGSTGLAVCGTLGATSLTARFAGRQARRQEAAARRERAAGIIGKVRTLLSDADADRLLFNFHRENTSADILRMKERFEPLRDELSIFASADVDPQVSDFATKLEVAILNLLNQLGWLVVEKVGNRDYEGSRELALLERKRALTLTRIVLNLVHGRGIGDDEKKLSALNKELQLALGR